MTALIGMRTDCRSNPNHDLSMSLNCSIFYALMRQEGVHHEENDYDS